MSVKVVRMQNGEDVVADVKEIRPESGKSAIAYEFIDAFTVQILRSSEDMFNETIETPMDELGEINLEFFKSSTSLPGGNQVNGLPPASSTTALLS